MGSKAPRKSGVALLALLAALAATAAPHARADDAGGESYSPFSEEGGLELPPGAQPDFDESNPLFDITQGQVNQALGFYSHGSLVNDSVFPLAGDGFVKILLPRNRKFGTFDIRAVVELAAGGLHHDFPGGERIQIGDVARNGGGPIGHISHQNGLDADIVYLRENHEEQDPGYVSPTPTGFQELFVVKGASGPEISPNFDAQRNWEFVKDLHSTGRIVRILMDPVIKAALCRYAQAIGDYDSESDVLRRIRPLVNHRDHMHVRITCPERSPSCQAQVEPPPGNGCDDVLPSVR